MEDAELAETMESAVQDVSVEDAEQEQSNGSEDEDENSCAVDPVDEYSWLVESKARTLSNIWATILGMSEELHRMKAYVNTLPRQLFSLETQVGVEYTLQSSVDAFAANEIGRKKVKSATATDANIAAGGETEMSRVQSELGGCAHPLKRSRQASELKYANDIVEAIILALENLTGTLDDIVMPSMPSEDYVQEFMCLKDENNQ